MSILIYTENWDGNFKKKTYELVSYGKALADHTGAKVIAVTIGDVAEEELQNLAKYGAEKIMLLQSDAKNKASKTYSKALSEIAVAENASLIVFSDNNTGKEIAPRLSARLQAGMVSGISQLPISYDPFVVKTNAFSGKSIATTKITTEKKIVLLKSNSFDLLENHASAEIIKQPLASDDSPINLLEVNKTADKIILTDAEIIVSGGRGMKSAENWGGIEEMAQLLNAGTGCSRPVSDDDWRPHEEHVGQTGKVVAPNVYFAFGISGAIQHIAGISGSKYIVAVNKDAEAPIFNVANFGVVGDVAEVIPKMINRIKVRKAD